MMLCRSASALVLKLAMAGRSKARCQYGGRKLQLGERYANMVAEGQPGQRNGVKRKLRSCDYLSGFSPGKRNGV